MKHRSKMVYIVIFATGTAAADEFIVEAKSYIAEVETSDPGEFSNDLQKMRVPKLGASLGAWENPLSGTSSSLGYRLYSGVTYDVTCKADGTATATLKCKEIKAGKENIGGVSVDASINWTTKPPETAIGKLAHAGYAVSGYGERR